MSSVSVKIPTAKFIEAVRTKLDELVKWRDGETARNEKYRKAVEAWEKQVRSAITKTTKPERVNVSTWRGDAVVRVEFSYEFPAGKFPPKPEPVVGLSGWDLKTQIEELGNALRLLELSDADYINASTYKSVAKYL